jgi:hypothetical protein
MVTESLGQLLKQVGRPGLVSQPEGLAAAMRESGVFFESGLRASLAGQPPAVEGDFKAGLFRVLARVEAALARIEALGMPAADAEALLDMKRELEAGLGRITLHQLNSQPDEIQASRHWQLEIPLQVGGSLHSLRMEIDREAGGGPNSQSDSEEELWRVKLQLEPRALGALEVSMQLQGDRLSLRIAAANDSVRQLIDAGMPGLVLALENRGIALTTSPSAELVPKKVSTEGLRSSAGLDLRA